MWKDFRGIVVKGLPPVKPIQELLIEPDDWLRFHLEPVAVPPGAYKITVRAKGKTIERSMTLTISVY